MAPDRSCILLFARSPRSEAIAKGVPGAEALFELAARRVIAAAKSLGIDLVVAGGWSAVPQGCTVLPQRGGTFGERLQAAFADARGLGYDRIVAVGNDTPGLCTRHLRRAFAALERHSVVLGPSADGGVYLIGAQSALEESFPLVRWNVRSTLSDLRRLRGAFLLERLADVDGRRDLDRLDAGRDRELSRTLSAIRRPSPISSSRLPVRFERIVVAHAIRGPPA